MICGSQPAHHNRLTILVYARHYGPVAGYLRTVMGAEFLNTETKTIEMLTLGYSTASFYIFSWLFLQSTCQQFLFLPLVRSGVSHAPWNHRG